MPPKSIFRQPGAQHFQLVHRSQRDPLIHDPDASQHVLKPFQRANTKKGKSRAELEAILPSSEIEHDHQLHVGEASLYGIYYDDTDYDYMQHLRPVGVQEEGVESVLIEAPSASKTKDQTKKLKGISFVELPKDVLASTSELPRNYESQQHIPESISGFQPDMDPHLRQVLEALDDDAFVDDDVGDDFFGELIAEGERNDDEEITFEFNEDGLDNEGGIHKINENKAGSEWEQQFAQFKKLQKDSQGRSDDGYESEDGDTIGGLPEMLVIGGKGKKRRKGTSDASGYSMSSSSMFRNEALQTLDERFDQIILKEYNEDEDEEHPSSDDEDDDEAPDLVTSREDFDSMINEFLNDYEILGRKLKPKLTGENGTEKLDTLRRAMGQDKRVLVASDTEEDRGEIFAAYNTEDKKDRWDCETILTTYTNLENHPRLIRARDPKPTPKISLDPRTGLPFINGLLKTPEAADKISRFNNDNSDTQSDSEPYVSQTIIRPRGESKEDKKARKGAVKAERQARRADKKATKEQFETELKTQKKMIANKEKRLKKL